MKFRTDTRLFSVFGLFGTSDARSVICMHAGGRPAVGGRRAAGAIAVTGATSPFSACFLFLPFLISRTRTDYLSPDLVGRPAQALAGYNVVTLITRSGPNHTKGSINIRNVLFLGELRGAGGSGDFQVGPKGL